jgi:Phage integrase family
VFDPAAKAVNVNGLTPHELRHTCASLAIAVDANVKVLQTLLGHKTATLTLDRYGHLFPDDLGRIADAFDAAAESTADALRTVTRLGAVSSETDSLRAALLGALGEIRTHTGRVLKSSLL